MPSELKVNKLSPYTGTTLTLGDSGDTFTLASGVSLTGVNATFSGDLTVDTNTLYVDSSNNNVGIGTSSPSTKLDVNGTVTASQFVGGGLNAFRNIIINGDMRIAQRGTSFTGLGNGDTSTYTLDRFAFGEGGAPTGECTISQDTDVPTGEGFASSLKVDVTTAEVSVAANSLIYLMQKVESQNLQYLSYGTSSAKKLTLSFWVKSNVTTGNFTVALYNNDATRVANLTYSISVANTWEKKTFTIDGDTVSGFDNDVGIGLYLAWNFLAGTDWTSGVGSTSWHTYTTPSTGNWAAGHTANLFSSTSNEWYLTGVQLEAGTTASDFEFLPYDVNLQRCQRYYQTCGAQVIYAVTTSTYIRNDWMLPTEMRVNATTTATFTDAGSATRTAQNFQATSPNSCRAYVKFSVQGASTGRVEITGITYDSEL